MIIIYNRHPGPDNISRMSLKDLKSSPKGFEVWS